MRRAQLRLVFRSSPGPMSYTGTKVMFPVSGNVQYRAKFPIQFPSHQEILPYTVQFSSVVLTCPFTFPVQGSSGNAIFLPVCVTLQGWPYLKFDECLDIGKGSIQVGPVWQKRQYDRHTREYHYKVGNIVQPCYPKLPDIEGQNTRAMATKGWQNSDITRKIVLDICYTGI